VIARLVALALLAVAGASAARAQDVVVQLDPAKAQAAGVDPDEVVAALRTAAAGTLNLDDQGAFLEQMARATALSSKGMGVDYGSNLQRFVVGGGVGTGADGMGATFGRGDTALPEGGFAFMGTVMAGLNLGVAAPEGSAARRFRIYAHGLAGSGDREPFAGSMVNYGGHLQVQLLRAKGTSAVAWNGVDFTTGYEAGVYRLTLESAVPISPGEGVQWDATGAYTVEARAASVPLELSTAVKVAVVSAWAGIGYDLLLDGSATSTIALGGDISASAQGRTALLGTAAVTGDASAAAPAVGAPRAFLGAQVNLAVVKVYGHLNLPVDRGFGGHAGVRIAL
jgi:hypothetical protein